MWYVFVFFFFKQKTAYEMRISDWSSDVCSSDLVHPGLGRGVAGLPELAGLPVHRTDVDDPAESARRHALDRVAAVVEHAVQVHLQHRVPLPALLLAQGGGAGHAGGLYRDVGGAERGDVGLSTSSPGQDKG